MAQEFQKNPVVNFSRGLITEQTPFELEANATVDELNITIQRDGSRSRRKGISFEAALSNLHDYATAGGGETIHAVRWDNAGQNASTSYLLVQVQARIWLYRIQQDMELAIVYEDDDTTPVAFSLNSFKHPGGPGGGEHKIRAASINGFCVITSPSLYPFYIRVDDTVSKGFSTNLIAPKARDFEWQTSPVSFLYTNTDSTSGDKSMLISNNGEINVGAVYDTYNSGWETPEIDDFQTEIFSTDRYPLLTHPWFSSKDSNGDFDAAGWHKIFGGTTLTANGTFVLDILDKRRNLAINDKDPSVNGATQSFDVSDLPRELEPEGFKAVASYAGRVWFGGLVSEKQGSAVFFSRIVNEPKDLGQFYQRNDPTAEYYSDLLQNDGGAVYITGCNNIKAFVVFGPDLLVFAENGVWAVRGVDGQFTPTSYYIDKITDIGITSSFGVVEAEKNPIYVSPLGIHRIVRDGDDIIEINLTRETIQTRFDELTSDQRSTLFAEYDKIRQQVYFFYQDDGEIIRSKYSNAIVYDLRFQAFFPWTFGEEASGANTSYVAGAFSYGASVYREQTLDVVQDGDDVVQDGDDVVLLDIDFFNPSDLGIKLVCFWPGIDPGDATADYDTGIKFATFASNLYRDFYLGENFRGGNYSSYLEAAYDWFGQAMLFGGATPNIYNKKEAPYIVVTTKITDIGWNKPFDLDNNFYFSENELTTLPYWDFKNFSDISGQTAIAIKEAPTFSPASPDTSRWVYPVSYTNKQARFRGRGRTMSVRFDSVDEKGFYLTGFEIVGSRNREYDN